MENREILIANTKTQKRSKITTNATTLGELKSALSAAGIDYSGMTFTEGISKTQLIDNNTQLPQNVLYKGQPTNNLVILLTNTKKNIASGIQAADRKAAYSIIKDYGFQEDIKEVFGRNFTQVPTADLQKFIADRTENPTGEHTHGDDDIECAETEPVEDDEITDDEITDATDYSICHIVETVRNLYNKGILDSIDMITLIGSLADIAMESDSEPVSSSDGSITDEDIDNMISELQM